MPSTLSISLPHKDRSLKPYRLRAPRLFPASRLPHKKRVAFAAAHVVADPLADVNPYMSAAIDWERTIAYRHHLWDLGFGVAEAMDTAQRGMGLDWAASLELIKRSVAAASGRRAQVYSGAGTDHLAVDAATSINDVIAAYEQQVSAIEQCGGRIILMCSRALARVARGAEDYERVYDRILTQVREPVIIHWLGEMFDPELAGYWGSRDHLVAMETALSIINRHASKVDGVKISLLDKEKEISMRRRLADGVRMYTGDDFNYPELIAGDGRHYSDALLGIFDAIAPAASAALAHLDEGDTARFHEILAPTVPLSRHIFKAPTQFYKTGVVFMAFLNGHQDHFAMVRGQESARSTVHLAEIFQLADVAGLLRDPELATLRMRAFLATRGIAA